METEEKIVLCDWKYTFYRKDHSLYCLRHGEEWRDFIGDKAVNALFDLALEAIAKRVAEDKE